MTMTISSDSPPTSSFRDDLRQLHLTLNETISQFGPVCQLSGRCCRFREYGHDLFVSEPEIEILLSEAPPPTRALDAGETCPWQDSRGHCSAREARPLGCRVFYCDESYQEHLATVGETFIGRLKRLVDRHGLNWSYAPLHQHLRHARDQGRFFDPT